MIDDAARFLDHVTGGPLGPVEAERCAVALVAVPLLARWSALGEALDQLRGWSPGRVRGWNVEGLSILVDRYAERAEVVS